MSGAEGFVPVGTDLETPLPAGDAESGEQIFADLNCAVCHGASDSAGPSLEHLREDMIESEGGLTPAEFLRESIVLPCAHETEGFNCSVMPADYGDKLDAQGLADVIEYLLAGE